jgi:hypothetical protein
VVYIGQSKKPLSRIEAHRSLWGRKRTPGWLPIKGMLFDEVHVLPCRIEDLDVVERAMIDLYKPKYNVKLKTPAHVPTTTELTITLPNGAVVPFNVPRAPTPRFERRI